MRALYTALLYLATPFVLLRLLWRSRELAAYRHRWNERFGFVARPAQPIAVWVHAVSVGETLAAVPLIRALIARHGAGRVWVTTTTPTGSERVTALFGADVVHSYAPYDLPDVVARFLARVRPGKIVVMETELWPNLLRAAAVRDIALSIVNARLSPRSFKGYSKVAGLARRTLADCRQIAAQSAADAERFRQLGAAQVSVMGNIKFDQQLPEAQLALGRQLRARLGARPVWIAASTHEGEDEILLAAHRALLATQADALLLLVPRHPQRFDAVARLVARESFTLIRRSALAAFDGGTTLIDAQVLLGDSMGEMFAYFAASDVAFVGGSLQAVGGHNVLEPAALGLPVLFGPFMHNFVAARDLLLHAHGGIEISAASLPDTLRVLLGDANRRHAIGAAGRGVVEANRGALHKLLAAIGET
ncbi:lipid IV(A) 3-deoxy-D-manno-octulosonic acid transferase [Solimonas terrae]|uniref:3-deoxy-D-manno-octulosonic acid transferase n=1 Tax=Solimonas terrae TaxID=1396819 RepID=A0A6M2BVL1_9GAMM|nr:lipid IV(A) 3-deoxy-D-manno-octulosonic acid transferase [Solimonas terrae]NGY06400.1 3-deoxy-D-manno-octulosonic acid transferase [Solimonas terrae]